MPGEDQGDHHRGYEPIRAIGIPGRSMNLAILRRFAPGDGAGKKIAAASGNTELMVR